MSVTSIDFVFGNDYYREKKQEETQEVKDASVEKGGCRAVNTKEFIDGRWIAEGQEEDLEAEAAGGIDCHLLSAEEVTYACYQGACV